MKTQFTEIQYFINISYLLYMIALKKLYINVGTLTESLINKPKSIK